MATEDANTPDPGEVIDLAKEEASAAADQGKKAAEQIAGEADEVASRELLQEIGNAAIGLGDAVTEAARNVDAQALVEQVRRAPVALASVATSLSSSARSGYLAMAERGRRVRGQAAGEPATEEAERQTKAAASQAKGAATATRKGAEEAAGRTSDAAAATRDKAKGAATSASKAAGAQAEAAKSTAKKAGDAVDTGTGALQDRTVEQLRNRASELDIEGRSNMKKDELVKAIRDAT
jgi:hypothetical protein